MLVPNHIIDHDSGNLTHDAYNCEGCRADVVAQQVARMRHTKAHSARQQQREQSLHSPVQVHECLLLVQEEGDEEQRNCRHSVGVEYAPPACHRHAVAHVLDINAFKDESHVPSKQPQVSLQLERCVHHHIAKRPPDQEYQAQPAAQAGQRAAQEHPVTQGHDHGRAGAEGDKGLYVGVLEHLDVSKNGAQEACSHPNKGLKLGPFHPIDFYDPQSTP
mmetsp:Transcript_12815/g.34956  ORF Transcript_12815/g.34956 Transcript_12815/m.34956 type:complete len:218 (+) Transcript_12815:827-1480(+)